MLLQGFNPNPSSGQFFERRRGVATLLSLAVYGSLLGWAFTREGQQSEQDTQVEVEIKDLQVPEEPKPEEAKPEPPPEPPPPPPEPEPKRQQPVVEPPPVEEPPAPAQPVVPDAMPDRPPSESDQAGAQGKAGDYDHAAANGKPGGSGTRPSTAAAAPAKPKPKASADLHIDPKVPVEKPEKASNPKPSPGNTPPKYPEILRTKGITGNVFVKILVYYDGSVRGAKILRKDNTATTPEDQELAAKLFVAAVGKVMPTWKYEPAKLNGQPISVWFSVNIPFTLSQE